MEYLEDPWNYFESLGAILQIVYFFLRVSNPINAIPPPNLNDDEKQQEFESLTPVIPLMNAILLVLAAFKILFFLRSYDEFGLMVQLIGVCLVNIFMFVDFMIIWIFIFAQINILLGVDYESNFGSQNNLDYVYRVFI
jgi:hypothetical protein